VNKRLAAMNKLLTEENERMQKQVLQLVNENGFMRQEVNIVSLPLFFWCIVNCHGLVEASICHMILVVLNLDTYCYLLPCHCKSQLLQLLMVEAAILRLLLLL
jgi:hypothetical protein